MRKLFLCLMLFLGAILGSASAANASPSNYNGPRHKFAKPSANPHELAERVRASLKLDPSGHAAIDGPNCKLACATPEDFVATIEQSDLRDIAPKTVGELADFLDKLVLQKAPEGVYWMACKSGDGSAGSDPVWRCMSRAFHAGEPCYAYKGHCVLARDCSNPVGREYKVVDCVRQLVWMNQGDILRWAALAPANAGQMPKGECEFLVREPGSEERAYAPEDKCPRADCTFAAPAAFLRMRVLGHPYSFQAKTSGWATIYYPNEITQWDGVMEYCIERYGSRIQMLGKDMHKNAYHNGDAYIVFSPGQVPAEWHGVPHVWQAIN